MRKISLLVLMLAMSAVGFAKIWRVNNNTGINADFTTLQAAHNGATAGDTLYLESSPTSYGALSASKKLTIIGTGYFLDQNLNLQAFFLPSKVDGITLNVGSAGSVIEGLSTNASSITINVNDVVIRRNFLGGPVGSIMDNSVGNVNINSNASNIIIAGNYALTIQNGSASTGILILNNFITVHNFQGENSQSTCLQLHTNTVAIVKNNIFRRGAVDVYNTNFSNNIMYAGYYSGSSNLLANNISNGTQFGTLNGNQTNVSMATVFELNGSADAFWKLKAGSPAIAAGYGSTPGSPVDCGMFGGSSPYALSGIPAIPTIYFFANQPVGSNSDPIDVQIKVRSNN